MSVVGKKMFLLDAHIAVSSVNSTPDGSVTGAAQKGKINLMDVPKVQCRIVIDPFSMPTSRLKKEDSEDLSLTCGFD